MKMILTFETDSESKKVKKNVEVEYPGKIFGSDKILYVKPSFVNDEDRYVIYIEIKLNTESMCEPIRYEIPFKIGDKEWEN